VIDKELRRRSHNSFFSFSLPMYIWHNITGSLKCSIPFSHVYSLFRLVALSVRSSSSFLDQLGQLVIASIRSAAGNACYREQMEFFVDFVVARTVACPALLVKSSFFWIRKLVG